MLELPDKAVIKIFRVLELLECNSTKSLLASGDMKKLKGYDIYELVIRFDKIFYRIFCVIRATTCWLLHIFKKKDQPHSDSRN